MASPYISANRSRHSAKAPREIVLPALRTQSASLPNLLHGHPEDQDVVHQCRAVGAKLMLGTIQAQGRLALSFRDGLAQLPPSTYSRVVSTARGPRSAFSQSF